MISKVIVTRVTYLTIPYDTDPDPHHVNDSFGCTLSVYTSPIMELGKDCPRPADTHVGERQTWVAEVCCWRQ